MKDLGLWIFEVCVILPLFLLLIFSRLGGGGAAVAAE